MSGGAVNQDRFGALVAATSDVVYRLSPDWEVMYELDGRGFLKSTSEPITGWRNINVHPDDLEMVNAAITRAIETQTMFDLEHRVLRADGSAGWTVSRAVPILDAAGNILEWFGAASDITLRKQTEIELQRAKEQAEQQQRLYETVTSNTPDLIYVFGLDYRFTYANKALLEMWGKSFEDSVGKSLLENGYEPWHAEMHEREIDQIIATGEAIRGEVDFPHAVLGKRTYDYILTPVFDANGVVVAVSGVTRDVTEQVNARKAIEQSEQHFRKLADLVPAKISNALPNGEVTFFNKHWLDFAGMGFEDLRDFGYHQLMHPDEIPAFQEGLVLAAEKGIPHVSEMRFKDTAGNYIWHLNIASPILDERGKITMWVGSTTDIQAIKQEEQRKSDFVSMLSHELKTPVTAIKGHVQLALRLLSREELSPFLEKMNSSLSRIDVLLIQLTALIGDMLDLSRIDAGRMDLKTDRFAIDDLVNEVVQDFRLSHQQHFFQLKLGAGTDIIADRDRISQVLINLLANAVKYSPKSNVVDITVSAIANEVLIAVKDYGIGIEEINQKRIFERFFRVEGQNEKYFSGFGIGLFLVHNIVTRHGGKITLESERDKGSVFTVHLNKV
jgi:PAS domain S-box-containing protein